MEEDLLTAASEWAKINKFLLVELFEFIFAVQDPKTSIFCTFVDWLKIQGIIRRGKKNVRQRKWGKRKTVMIPSHFKFKSDIHVIIFDF